MHKKLHQNDYICQHFSWLKYIFCLGIQPVHAFPVGLIYMINYFKYYSLSLISPSFQYPIVLDSVSFLLRTWIPCNTLSCRRPFYSRGLPHTEKKAVACKWLKSILLNPVHKDIIPIRFATTPIVYQPVRVVWVVQATQLW